MWKRRSCLPAPRLRHSGQFLFAFSFSISRPDGGRCPRARRVPPPCFQAGDRYSGRKSRSEASRNGNGYRNGDSFRDIIEREELRHQLHPFQRLVGIDQGLHPVRGEKRAAELINEGERHDRVSCLRTSQSAGNNSCRIFAIGQNRDGFPGFRNLDTDAGEDVLPVKVTQKFWVSGRP